MESPEATLIIIKKSNREITLTNLNSIKFDTPFKLARGEVIKNRFFKSAMSEQLGDKNHDPRPGLATLYGRWAAGGVGLMVTGNVMVDRTALGEPHNVVLDQASSLPLFEKWAAAGRADDARIWVQINHPGKQIPNFLCKEPVAPSAVPLGAGLEKVFNVPRALMEDEILAIVDKFARSARLVREAGFDGVQIHGAHGYLVSQFLSPRHNQREDQWGGSPENRTRFVLEVYRAMRRAVGDKFPIGIKLNSADFMKDGLAPEDSMAVIRELENAGIDLVEISGGTYESPAMMGHRQKESTRKREAYFLDYAEKVRQFVKTPLVVTGGFRSGPAMREALRSGATDMIGMARPLAVDPDFTKDLLADPDHSLFIKRPTTGSKYLDRMTMLDITWYERQLGLMAAGKSPQKNLGAWRTALGTLLASGRQAFKKRRS
jgi:2,4-dienoyl-CoA reductase-like NADH-dependent reductase (Old Yellow Enzyme family)